MLVVNAVGAFALAALLTALARRPSERVRLLVGTGLLGGLTTFSGLVVEAVLLARGRPAVGGGVRRASRSARCSARRARRPRAARGAR